MRIYRYIYRTINLINGKIYIGKRSTRKLPSEDNYKGSGKVISNAFKLYGKENFSKEILAYRNSEDEIYALEALYVTKVQVKSKQYYNIKEGGLGASKGSSNHFYGKPGKGLFSEKARQKAKEVNKLKLGDKNHFYGKHHTDVTKKKLSESAKLRIGNKNHFFTKTHSDLSKLKQSESKKNKFLSDPDYSLKLSWSKSKGLYITPIGIYLSSVEASKSLGLSKAYLVSICTDKNTSITGTKHFIKDIYKSEIFTWKDFGFGFEEKLDRDYETIKLYISKFNENLTNSHLIK